MKKLFSLCLALAGMLTLPAQSGDDRWTPKDIIYTEYAREVSVSPDGQMIAWTKRKGVKEKDKFVSDIYLTRLNVQKKDKPLTVQLTNADENDSSPLFSRDGETIYFQSSRDKGKKLWSLSIYGGEPREVYEFKNGLSGMQWLSDSTFAFIAHDGETLYEQKLKEKKDNTVVVEDSVHWTIKRIYRFNLKDKQTERLTENDYPVRGFEASRDGRWLVYSTQLDPDFPADANPDPLYYLHDLESGQARQILANYQTPGNFQFTADHAGFYFMAVTSSDPEWNGAGISELYFYDLNTNEITKVDLQWEWATEGRYHVIGNDVLVTLSNGPTDKLAFYKKTAQGWTKSEPDLGGKNGHVDIQTVSKDGKKVAYAHSTAEKLPRYYAADLEMSGNDLKFNNETEWVVLNEKLHKKPKVRAEVIRWQGYNDEEVTGILYYPAGYEEGKRYPLMLSIHGGPTGYDQDQWSERWSTYPQLICQRGAFVLKPNYHGSGNHGRAFMESIKKNYYTPELEDIIKGIDYLDERGLVDREKLGTMGWSNGAILTTMLTVRYPDMFKVACPGAGDVNWTSDYGTCRFGVSFDQSYFGGAPWDDVDDRFYNPAYIEQSPLFELDKVKTPTIIFHGSEDRAVPRDQGWEYYRALSQIGQAPVRFLWFPDQPHGLRKITHQMRKMTEELAWIDRFLFGKEDISNEAFKEDSPLALLLKRDSTARYEGRYGLMQNGTLVPETVEIKADSTAIGRYEVTNAQYRAFDPRHVFLPNEANHPARVSFEQAKGYLTWLNKKTGKTYRLPTAEEAKALHEKGAKVAAKENTFNYWAGYEITKDEVVALRLKLEEVESSLFMEVGQFPPVKVGEAEVFDLGGNVAEWNAAGDTYGYSAYDYVDPQSEAVAPGEGHVGFRVVLD